MPGLRIRLPATSFRSQIALVFGAVVLVLVVGLSVALGAALSETTRANESNALRVVARNAQRELADGLHQQLSIVEHLAASTALWRNGLSGPEIDAALAQLRLAREDLAWIGVSDAQGIVRAASDGVLLGGDVSARPWFRAGLQGPHVGDVHAALLLAKLLPPSRLGEPQRFVDFAAPIRVDGQVVGVFSIHGSWDWARGVIEAMLPANAAALAMDVYVVDRTGAVIYAPTDMRSDAVKLGDSIGQVVRDESASADVVRWPDDRDYLTAAVRLEPRDAAADLGWHVVARIPKDIAYAPVEAAVTKVASAGIVAALIAMLLAWAVAGKISGPLTLIARAAQDLKRGKAGATMPAFVSYVELQELSTALTEMTETFEARVRDRTLQLEQANGELARAARHDPLTGLLNRRGFDEQMLVAVSSARRRKQPLSIIAVDVDHFKKVNDDFGHAAGDAVLTSLAALMKSWFRGSDIIGRLGGEEFTILLTDTTLAGAFEAANGLVTTVAAARFEGVGQVTVSCGVSEVAVTEAGSISALGRADRALYAAKAAGRNRVQIQESENVRSPTPQEPRPVEPVIAAWSDDRSSQPT